MNINALFRQIHRWASVAIMLPLGLVIIAGIFLMLKKEFDWIQPPSQAGINRETAPETRLSDLYAVAVAIPELDVTSWPEFDRIDIRADKGIAKFVAPNRWEAQIDLETLEIVQLAYRRSDLIESLHDGSFFSDWVKLYIFLPVGLVLLTLWITGIYLFFLPHVKRYQRRQKQARKRADLPH
jgi:uncharacterized iron-regulated membrane protein